MTPPRGIGPYIAKSLDKELEGVAAPEGAFGERDVLVNDAGFDLQIPFHRRRSG